MITAILKKKLNDQTAKFWTAVSAHETAGWTSKIYRENHNLFGMRLPSGNTTATGERSGHAVFTTDADSIRDLLLYFDRLHWTSLNFNSIDDLTAYMRSKGYYTDTFENYSTGVKAWYKKIYG